MKLDIFKLIKKQDLQKSRFGFNHLNRRKYAEKGHSGDYPGRKSFLNFLPFLRNRRHHLKDRDLENINYSANPDLKEKYSFKRTGKIGFSWRWFPGFIILLAAAVLFTLPRLYKISDIRCRSQYGDCNPEIISGLDKIKYDNYSSAKNRIKKLLKESLLVRDYQLQLKLPNYFELNILENRPKYSIANPDKKNYANIDKEGKTLFLSKESALPTLVIDGQLPGKGTAVDNGRLFALKVIRDLSTSYQVKEGRLVNDSLVIELPTDLRVIFPLDGDREILIGGLNLIYQKLRSPSGSELAKNSAFEALPDNKVRTIDLRFKNPILK